MIHISITLSMSLKQTIRGMCWISESFPNVYFFPGILLLYENGKGLCARFAHRASATKKRFEPLSREWYFILVDLSPGGPEQDTVVAVPHAGLVVVHFLSNTFAVFNPHGYEDHLMHWKRADDAIMKWVNYQEWGETLMRSYDPKLCPDVQNGGDSLCLYWCFWFIRTLLSARKCSVRYIIRAVSSYTKSSWRKLEHTQKKYDRTNKNAVR